MKKLLLILLCLPMIGFGQSDKIIFSSGDTIIGKVIEVGVNDITYQHKGETTNNVVKKRELAKIIYSSGRLETFEGLKVLESNIDFLKRKENNEIKYLYLNSFINILNNKIESELISLEFQNVSKISYGIGYNFYNINKYSIDFELNYINKSYQSDSGLILRGIYDDDMTVTSQFKSGNGNFISFRIVNNLQLFSVSSLNLYFTIAPIFDVLLSDKWNFNTSSTNKGKGNPQRVPKFSATFFSANCGFGIQKNFDRLFIKTSVLYEYSFGNSNNLVEIYDLNKDIFNNNILLQFCIGRFI